VLTVDVTAQVDLALKRPLLADVTGERLEAGVFAAVSDEVRRLAERFAALATRVRLLTFNTAYTVSPHSDIRPAARPTAQRMHEKCKCYYWVLSAGGAVA